MHNFCFVLTISVQFSGFMCRNQIIMRMKHGNTQKWVARDKKMSALKLTNAERQVLGVGAHQPKIK